MILNYASFNIYAIVFQQTLKKIYFELFFVKCCMYCLNLKLKSFDFKLQTYEYMFHC